MSNLTDTKFIQDINALLKSARGRVYQNINENRVKARKPEAKILIKSHYYGI